MEAKGIYKGRKKTDWKVNLLQKDEMYWKSMEALRVFTKGGMNNDWNVYLLQKEEMYWKSMEALKVFTKEEWTMTESFIFFKRKRCIGKVWKL